MIRGSKPFLPINAHEKADILKYRENKRLCIPVSTGYPLAGVRIIASLLHFILADLDG